MNESVSKVFKIIHRNRWTTAWTFLSVFTGIVVYLLITPRLYSAKVRLILDQRPATSISPLGRDIAQTPGDNNKGLATQEELVRSKSVLTKAIVLFNQSNEDSAVEKVTLGEAKQEVSTEVIPGTQIIEISFRHTDPQVTSSLLNLIASSVIQENAETIRSEARATRQFLENQIPRRQQELVKIESSISQFKQQYNIVSLEETDNKRLTQSIAEAEKVAEEISAELKQVQARGLALSKIIDQSSDKESYLSTKAGQNPELISLRDQLSNLESQLKIKRESLTDDHPDIQKLITEKEAAQALYQQKLSTILPGSSLNSNGTVQVANEKVAQELSEKLVLSVVERNELRDKLANTRSYISTLDARRKQYPVLEKTLASLQRKKEGSTESVNLLRQKLDEARIAEAQLVSNLRIIEEANKPTLPSYPNIPSFLVLGIMAAVALSAGVTLSAEGMDGRLRDLENVEELAKVPLLGVIPLQKSSRLFPALPFAELYNNLPLLESVRGLSKNIEYKNSTESKVLVITSAISGEGKSFVAANLAVLSAMLSKKTLLIDADMRRPTIHKLFQVSQDPGLQDYLRGAVNEGLPSAIHSTSIKNLSVMTSGKFSYDNVFSFETQRAKELLAEVEQHYDVIVIDTPPVMACSDALVLSQGDRQTIMVARLDVTPKQVLNRSIDILNSNNVNVVGLAINGVSSSTDKYYRYLKEDYALAA